MKKIFFLIAVSFVSCVFPQQWEENEYGLKVVNNEQLYAQLVSMDSSKLFIDLEDFIPRIIMDVRYATDNNFYGSPVYDDKKLFLRKSAAEALFKIQEELLAQNKCLKIYDAYRPYSVTVLFYEKVKDTNFVASAYTGSRHNRGCAVDLTVVDIETGQELRMPTEYDDFSEKAAIDYMDAPKDEISNRELLQNIMIKYGFLPLKSEWWHFDFKDWKNYEITDLNFRVLDKFYSEYVEEKEYAR